MSLLAESEQHWNTTTQTYDKSCHYCIAIFLLDFIAPCVFLLTTRNHGVHWVSPSYKSYSCQSRGQRKETCGDTACPTTGSRAHYFEKSGEVPQSMKRICLPLLFLVLTDASLLTVRSFPSQRSHIVTQPSERKKRDLL